MATIIKPVYAGSGAITITLNSLASSGTAGRASTAVDNSVNLYDEVLIQPTIAYPNLAPANDKMIYFYAYASWDGTHYPEGITGTDAAYTIAGSAGALTTSLRLIGIVPAVQNTTQDYWPMTLSLATGGIVATKWGIVVLNFSGQTLGAASNAVNYAGYQYTNV